MRHTSVLAAVLAATLSVGASLGAVTTAGASGLVFPANAGLRAVLHHARGPRVAPLGAARAAMTPAVLAAPVPAMTVHDRKGDTEFPQGDLTGVGMLQNSTGTTFGVTVSQPTNPTTDPNWIDGDAVVVWLLDSNRDGKLDYQVILGDDITGMLIAIVTDASGRLDLCEAAASFITRVGYRATAPADCLPRLTSVRFGAGMSYDNDLSDPNPPVDLAPDNAFSNPISVQQIVHGNGYWMLGADGHVYAFGGAQGFSGFVSGAVAMAPRRDGSGYWVVDRAGHVFTYGTARYFGGAPALGAGEFVSTLSTTQDDAGYWLFTNKGRAFPFGNARSFGDMSGTVLNGPIVASVATPTGRGYYMVGSDGGIFTFGDARFHGSTGGIHLNKPVVGISPTPDSRGYWLVATDGGVFAFGAPFRGSMGAAKLNRPVDGLVAFGNGYLMAASDGGIFDFSNKPFEGSLAEHPPTAPIIGVAAFST